MSESTDSVDACGSRAYSKSLSNKALEYACWTVIAALTVYGGWLRFFDLGAQSLWLDEGVSVIHAKAILKHGYPLLLNGRASWDSFPVHYLMAICVNAFPEVQLGSRIMSCLFGTAAIPLMFFLCRNLSRSRIHGLLAATLITFSTIEIAWSRQARLYSFLQCFSLASILCAFRFADRLSVRHFCGAAGLGALAILTHRAGYIPAVVLTLVVLIALPSLWRRMSCGKHRSWTQLAVIASVLAVVAWGVLIVPSHSNLIDAARRVARASSINHLHAYVHFLWQQTGSILPLSLFGILLGSFLWPRRALPLAIGTCLYFYVISFAWRYFSFRYAFPLVAPLVAFGIIPVVFPLHRFEEYRRFRIIRIVFCLILAVVSLVGTELTLIPRERYLLGYTAPQPEWKDAYDMIRERDRRLEPNSSDDQGITTVSAIPLFHDLYLGADVGRKYYLPISFTGYPGDEVLNEWYTTASTVHSLEDLLAIKGYLILDDFGLRMLVNKDIQSYLSKKTPNAVLKHGYNVFVWILCGNGKAEQGL